MATAAPPPRLRPRGPEPLSGHRGLTDLRIAAGRTGHARPAWPPLCRIAPEFVHRTSQRQATTGMLDKRRSERDDPAFETVALTGL
jgi:hypothetical protein